MDRREIGQAVAASRYSVGIGPVPVPPAFSRLIHEQVEPGTLDAAAPAAFPRAVTEFVRGRSASMGGARMWRNPADTDALAVWMALRPQ